MTNKRTTHMGFTLLEVLVVISIIGILVSIVVSNLVGARERARDAARKQQMNEFKTALRLYYNDMGEFPAAGTGGDVRKIHGCTSAADTLADCDHGGVFEYEFTSYTNRYMDQLPTGSDDTMTYTRPTTETYTAKVLLENAGDGDIEESQVRCLGSAAAATDETPNYYVCEK